MNRRCCRRVAITFGLGWCLGLASLSARTWTDAQGRKLEAEFVSLQGDIVTVREKTGTLRRVKLADLSAADRQFAAAQPPAPPAVAAPAVVPAAPPAVPQAPAASAVAPAPVAAAQPAEAPPAVAGRAPVLASLKSTQYGPVTAAIGAIGEMQVPKGYVFIGADETRQLLEAMGNPATKGELGMLAPEAFDWFVIFEFSDIGYVKDDDKDQLNADKMLESIRQGNAAANKERKKRGWDTMEIVGWAEPPNYDPQTNNLQWAIKGRSRDGETVNYNVRLLGRRGVMEACLVADPGQMAAVVPIFKGTLKAYSFKSGEKYAEFTSGDKIAKYGLAALVTGGAVAVAAKTGMLKHVWKLLVVAALAVGGFFKKIFGGKERA